MIAATNLTMSMQRPLLMARDVWQGLTLQQRRMAGGALGVLLIGVLVTTLSSPSQSPSVSVKVAPSPHRVVIAMPPRPSSKGVASAEATPATPMTPAPDLSAVNPSNANDLPNLLRGWQTTTITLPPAPISDLQVATQDGLLPRVAPDGRAPWRVYGRPAMPEGRVMPAGVPMIAVLMVDMGLSQRLTGPALEQLPGHVSVAFSVYSPNLDQQIANARRIGATGGHEVFLDIPSEPDNYPATDPGPDALLNRLSAEQNLQRLRPMLSKAPSVAGLTTQGGRFASNGSSLGPVLQELNLRGLGWVDATPTPAGQTNTTQALANTIGNPAINADVWADTVLSPSAINAQLTTAVQIAKQTGRALIIARPYPLTVKMLNDFFTTLPGETVALVPVTALINRHGAQNQGR